MAELYDLNGHLIKRKPFAGSEQLEMEIGEVPVGTYVLKVGRQALQFNIVR